MTDSIHSPEEIQRCISLLESLAERADQFALLPEDQKIALLKAAGRLSRPSLDEKNDRKKARRRREREVVVAEEKKARASTGIRRARESDVFSAPRRITAGDGAETGELHSPRNCYICKAEFTRLHFFYDALCPECGEFNYKKRFQTVPLQGRTALVTGGRVKIGYQAVLKLLRAGARVVVTTRFPVDASLRYSREEDFPEWKDRLHIYGLDLRHIPSVELFTTYFENRYERLDILINNAAQTVRRPPGFYAHLLASETGDFSELSVDVQLLLGDFNACIGGISSLKTASLPVSWSGNNPGIGLRESAQLSQLPYTYDHSIAAEKVFPRGKLDADLQQVDLRETNSWRLRLGEIVTAEMLELQLINAVAPFVLCNRLVGMMKREYTGEKHIVNVSAMEGKFLRFKKDSRHPHTNMAKASLNMLTHTAAEDLAKEGIFINAVDTGWVTDEDPEKLAREKRETHDFQPPLDIVDGAARVCDPFFHGIATGKHWSGKFLKDYFPIDW